jgi:diaminopimelate epimerase
MDSVSAAGEPRRVAFEPSPAAFANEPGAVAFEPGPAAFANEPGAVAFEPGPVAFANEPGRLAFAKGHGTGNDFVILPDPDGRLALTPALVAALCDRRRGIGGDGVLRVVRAAKHPDAAGYAGEAEWFMDYWNADGSCAEMCGNGVRVFTRYLVDSGLADVGPAGLPLATRAGVVRAVVGDREIAAALALPRIGGSSMATVDGQTFTGTVVDCGNPHLVCTGLADDQLSTLDLSRPPGYDPAAFPAGVNVEFVSPVAELHVRMRVYERGSGETLSCGSGACAVAAAVLGEADLDDGTVTVDVPGGRLTITLDGEACWLAGPAVIVATGTLTTGTLVP